MDSKHSSSKLAKYRYGREEFLALFQDAGVESTMPEVRNAIPPQYYVEKPQEPVSMEPFTAAEQHLLIATGINSRKALALARAVDEKLSPPTATARTTGFGVPDKKGSPVSPAAVVTSEPLLTPQTCFASGIGRGVRVSGYSAGTGVGLGRGRQFLKSDASSWTAGSSFAEKTDSVSSAVSNMEPLQTYVNDIEKTLPSQMAFSTGTVASKSVDAADCNYRWYYIDPHGVTQGPFDSADMAAWFANAYFTMALMVRREDEVDYTTLGDLIKKYGRIPFVNRRSSKTRVSETGSIETDCTKAPSVATAAASIVHPTPRYAKPQTPVHELTVPAAAVTESSFDSIQGHEAGGSNASIATSARCSSVDSELLSLFKEEQPEGCSIVQQRSDTTVVGSPTRTMPFIESMQDAEEKRRHEYCQQKIDEALKKVGQLQLSETQKREQQIKLLQQEINAEKARKKALEEARRVEEELKKNRVKEEEERHLDNFVNRNEEERAASDIVEEEQLWYTEDLDPRLVEQCKNESFAEPSFAAAWTRDMRPLIQENQTQAKPLREILEEEERQQRAEKRQEMLLAISQRQNDAERSSWNGMRKDQSSLRFYDDNSSHGSDPSPAPADHFTNWCVKQVRGLNAEIDAGAAVEFLKEFDSPIDLEKYVLAFFGDCLPVRDFLDKFLEKRNMIPASKLEGTSVVSSRARSLSRAHHQAGQKNKKKVKMIVDASSLGFTSTADPNRVNAGKIDHPWARDLSRAHHQAGQKNKKKVKMIVDASSLGFTSTADPNRVNADKIDHPW